MVIHFQAFWGTDGPKLVDMCVCVSVCVCAVCVCVLVFVFERFTICLLACGCPQPTKLTSENVAQGSSEDAPAALVEQDCMPKLNVGTLTQGLGT